MEFLSSETAKNLARSFAGESQARTRYSIYAEIARTEKQEYLARIFDETAGNELAHAKEFLETIQRLGKRPAANIEFDAGYPFELGTTEENLAFAAEGERQEHEKIYPAFAAAAREEGFPEAAQLWEQVARIEGEHLAVYEDALRQLKDGTLYRKEQPKVWRCLNCGFLIEAEEPWAVCPVCHRDGGWVQAWVDRRPAPKDIQI